MAFQIFINIVRILDFFSEPSSSCGNISLMEINHSRTVTHEIRQPNLAIIYTIVEFGFSKYRDSVENTAIQNPFGNNVESIIIRNTA